MTIFSKTRGVALAVLSILSIQAVSAHCPRCVKIEQERAKEQAEQGPQPDRYYDDKVSLTTPEDLSRSSNNDMNANFPLFSGDTVRTKPETFPNESTYGAPTNTPQREFPSNRPFIQEQDQDLRDPTSAQRYIPTPQTYSTIFAVLQSRDFLRTLNGPFTFFIPSNEAIRHLPPGMLQDLLRPENQDRLANLIGNHLVAAKLNRMEMGDKSKARVKTVNGKDLVIQIENGTMTVNGVHVLKSENMGNNGIIYIVDEALVR